MSGEDKQRKKNQRIILLVFILSIIPFFIAWVFTKNPHWLSGSANRGQLIIPPVTTERSELYGYDQFSTDNLTELNGHWVMINVIPEAGCDRPCREAIHKTRQLRLMMNKDLTRIRRAVVIFKTIDTGKVGDWWQGDVRLLRLKADARFIDKLKTISEGKLSSGMLFLMDPFANLIMMYEAGFDPYDVKKDLKRLLRISQIG